MRDRARAHRLPDGATVFLRALRRSDERALRAAFRELSPHTRHQRFLGPVSELSDALWRYLCDVDGRDHVAVVALPLGGSRVLGVARFVRQSTNPSVAEMAITVTDAWQRRGVGTVLLDRLVDEAAQRNVDSFVAHALANNVAIRRLLARHGPLHTTAHGGEEMLLLQLRDPRAA